MKWKHLAIMFTAILLLFGCSSYNNKNTDESRGTADKTIEKTRYNEDGKLERNNRNITRKTRDNANITDKVSDRDRHSNNRSSNNRQDEYDVSKEAADRIVDEIAEIDRAYVLTTKNNAYVAAQLDEGRTNPNDHISKNDRNNSSAGMNVRNVNDRNVSNRTVNDGDSNARRSDNHMANRRDVEGHDVTDDVKNKVADIVQDVDQDIDNVYVSTSPDFFDLAGNYATDMDEGKPVRGFFDQLGNTIERIFPQNKR